MPSGDANWPLAWDAGTECGAARAPARALACGRARTGTATRTQRASTQEHELPARVRPRADRWRLKDRSADQDPAREHAGAREVTRALTYGRAGTGTATRTQRANMQAHEQHARGRPRADLWSGRDRSDDQNPARGGSRGSRSCTITPAARRRRVPTAGSTASRRRRGAAADRASTAPPPPRSNRAPR